MTSNDFKLLPPRPEARQQVQALQAKLYERAHEDPSKVFGGIYNLVHHPAVLVEAAVRVLSNKGANTPGIDGVTKSTVKEMGLEKFVMEILTELKTRKFNPSHQRPVDIAKSNGSTRHLKIPTLADRVYILAVPRRDVTHEIRSAGAHEDGCERSGEVAA